MSSLKPLQLVKKRYRIISQVGKGGFGTVYRAEDTLLGLPVALKAIGGDERCVLDLRREARHLARLKHVCIPSYLDFFEERGRWCLVMEWIEGGHVSTAQPLALRQVVWVGKQVCNILHYLHAQCSPPVIHRDIKPSNIMLSAFHQLYLVDFGISCHPGPNEVIAGSQGYAAPEQWARGQITTKADIYSLGMTLRQLLTGQAPAEQASTTHKAASQETHIPTGWSEQPEYCQLARLLAHMTAQFPDERPDVQEVERELENLHHLILKGGTYAQR